MTYKLQVTEENKSCITKVTAEKKGEEKLRKTIKPSFSTFLENALDCYVNIAYTWAHDVVHSWISPAAFICQ